MCGQASTRTACNTHLSAPHPTTSMKAPFIFHFVSFLQNSKASETSRAGIGIQGPLVPRAKKASAAIRRFSSARSAVDPIAFSFSFSSAAGGQEGGIFAGSICRHASMPEQIHPAILSACPACLSRPVCHLACQPTLPVPLTCWGYTTSDGDHWRRIEIITV